MLEYLVVQLGGFQLGGHLRRDAGERALEREGLGGAVMPVDDGRDAAVATEAAGDALAGVGAADCSYCLVQKFF